jgi:hypothetical protein
MPSPQIPQSDQPVLDEFGFFTTSWFTFFQSVYKAIRSPFKVKLSGIINVNSTPASNTSTGETDLITYLLAADTLVNNQDVLEIDAWGTYAANANNKTVKLVFGSQTILTTGAVAANDGTWKISARIIRNSATTQEIEADTISSNSGVVDSATRTAGTQDLTTALTIKCTGTGGATSDITQYAMIVRLTPYD